MHQRNVLITGIAAGLVVLAGGLAASWLTLGGQLRNTRWQPPQAVTIDTSALVPSMPQSQPARDERQQMQLQERPLFILSRKPLPSARRKAQDIVEPDFWDQTQVMGTFEGRKSGAILMVNGQEQRLLLEQSLGGWTLIRILPRQIELGKDGVTRRLDLHKAALDTGPDPALYGAPPARAADTTAGRQVSRSASVPVQPEPPRPRSLPVFGGSHVGQDKQ